MRTNRMAAAIAAAATLAIAACSSGGSTSASTSAGSSGGAAAGTTHATLSWWNNGTAQPLRGIWQNAANTFNAAHPTVTIDNVPHQNEFFKTNMPIALRSNNPPDIYQQWGGGGEATQFQSGKLANLTQYVSSWISEVG